MAAREAAEATTTGFVVERELPGPVVGDDYQAPDHDVTEQAYSSAPPVYGHGRCSICYTDGPIFD